LLPGLDTISDNQKWFARRGDQLIRFKKIEVLLPHDVTCGRYGFGWCWRNRERDPGAAALREVLGGDVLVGFQVKVAAILAADREQESKLRADAKTAIRRLAIEQRLIV
jgi:hypothetical protein